MVNFLKGHSRILQEVAYRSKLENIPEDTSAHYAFIVKFSTSSIFNLGLMHISDVFFFSLYSLESYSLSICKSISMIFYSEDQ